MLNLPEGMTLDGFRLTRKIHQVDGRAVFAATGIANPARRAIVKVVSLDSPTDVIRIHREFDVLREVCDAGVVAALGHGTLLIERLAFLVLAAQGPSLATLLASAPKGRLDLEVALAAAHSAAIALGQLHARGWQHGDLKPGNLLLDQGGHLLLSDLEFASPVDRVAESLPDSLVIGTPPFVAPELWHDGAAAMSPAADVWALGVTLYLALVGDYPFGHSGHEAIAAAIQQGPPPHLARLPQAVAALLGQLLAVDPCERLRDGNAAAARIAQVAEQLGIDLAAARHDLARQAGALADTPAPPEPGTMVAPPTPLPAAPSASHASPPGSHAVTPPPASPPRDIPTTLTAPQLPAPRVPAPRVSEPPSTAATPLPFPRSPASGAGERAPAFPEGIGSADSGGGLLRPGGFFDVSSKAVVVQPRPRSGVRPAATIPVSPVTPAAGQTASPPSPSLREEPMPGSAPGEAASVGAGPAAQLTRRAAARWYRRMNPEKNFPLSVVFSGKKIRIVGGSGLGVTMGQREIVLDAADPVLSVEPSFPGCLISPPRADVHVTQETTICRFWVTPLVCGDLPEACITVRYRGKVVETLATPSQVVTRTTAKVFAILGLATPVVSKILELAGWDPDELLRRMAPYLAEVVTGMGLMRSGLFLTSLLLAAAVGYFYITRPLLSDEPEPALLPQACA
jgi:serine/threonine protein kinase